jgi:Heterokaryon incompatibility protein (HET)
LRQHRQDEAGNAHMLLWIDAICINQDDREERRQQIGMMCRLYSRCSKLIVWLGAGDDDSKAAIDLLKTTVKMQKEGAEALRSWKNTLASRLFKLGENHHTILSNFLSRAWFSRAWIVQEYVLGCMNDMVFKCGGLQFSYKEIYAVLALEDPSRLATNGVKDPKTAVLPNRDGSGSEEIMWQVNVVRLVLSRMHFSRISGSGNATNLLFWLSTLRHANATDPRDKVYAVLGLAESLSQNKGFRMYDVDSLIVDYSKPIQDIYSSLVKSLAISTKRLGVLLACCSRSHQVNRSWTPDWTISPTRYPGFQSLWCGSADEILNRKNFISSVTRDAVVTFASDLSTMTVRGLVWDLVGAFSSNIGIGFEVAKKNIGLFETKWHALIKCKAYFSERDCLKRLWQTILLEPATGVDELRSEDDFVALGLNDISDTATQNLRSRTPDGTLTLHTPRFLEETVNCEAWLTRVFLSSRNFIGKDFSGQLQPGDLICVLLGCHVPVALRRVGTHYQFIRSVYLDGIMFGEAMEALERGEVKLEDFELH